LILIVGFSFFAFSGCTTQAAAERKLAPPKSISELRFGDMEKYTAQDPTRAIHLLEVYNII
jgi:hypothetical protein